MLAKHKNSLPADPLHPFYYHIYASTLPPESAYRLVPKSKFIINNICVDKDRISKGVEESKSRAYMHHRRYLYQGW